jgi:hypothetical protein
VTFVERLSSLAKSEAFKRPWSLAPRPVVFKDTVLAEYAGVTTRVLLTERKVFVTRPWSEYIFSYSNIKRIEGGYILGDRATTEYDPAWGLLIETKPENFRGSVSPGQVYVFPMRRSAKKAAMHIYALTRTTPHLSGSQESSTT